MLNYLRYINYKIIFFIFAVRVTRMYLLYNNRFLKLLFVELSEEWALATSLKDFSDNPDDALDEIDPETFPVKYLGSTVIEAARSEEATAEAVKAVIATAKCKGLINYTVLVYYYNRLYIFSHQQKTAASECMCFAEGH